MEFREKLIALRARDKMTQTALARAVGVTRQAVYLWEKGLSYPEAEALLALKRLFGVSIDALLDDALPLPEGCEKTEKKPDTKPTKILPKEMRNTPKTAPGPTPGPPTGPASEPETKTAEKREEKAESGRLLEEKSKTPVKKEEKSAPQAGERKAEAKKKQPLRAKIEPSAQRHSGSILDLLGSFLRRRK